SDSFLVYSGNEASPLNLVERLDRLDYRRVDAEPGHAGEYRYQPSKRLLEIYLRNFNYPNRFFQGFPVRVGLEEGKIADMCRLDDGESIESIEFEPEILAGIYDQAAEERRIVKLGELPKLLVQAVLAAEDHRFFEHRGIDFRGVARALWTNVREGRL